MKYFKMLEKASLNDLCVNNSLIKNSYKCSLQNQIS